MNPGPATQTSSASDGRLPPAIPDHKLYGKIAEGSYGEVWLAETVLGKRRAVKVVRRDRFPKDDPFRRELEGIRLYEPHSRNHEGLVDVLQVGHEPQAGLFYYVMELADALPDRVPSPASVSGMIERCQPAIANRLPPTGGPYVSHTLEADLAAGARLPVAECVKLGLALADALKYLHGVGLVHRDVKPANIIFVGGKPKLADPGSITDANRAGTQIGTEGFIPPEGRGSPQGDLYSLGKLLYSASTGKAATEFPNPPLDLDTWPDHQEWLELNELLTTACAGDLQTRYASTAEMRADLALIASGQSLRVQRGLRGKLARARRIAGVLAVTMLLVASVGFWQHAQARRLAHVAAQTHLAQALSRVETGDLLRSLPHFVRALELDAGGSKREEIQRFRLSRVLDQCPRLAVMGVHADGLYFAGFSPDGRRVLTASADHSARVWSAETGVPITPPVLHSNEVRHASFDPAGQRFATASADGTARVWDAGTGRPVTAPLPHGGAVTWVSFRCDGVTLATACYDGVVRLWDSATGVMLHELRGHTGEINQAHFNTVGDRLATASDDGTSRLWNPAMGEELAKLEQGDGVYCVAFSPDDRLLATGSKDGTARLWDGRTGAGPRLEFRLARPVHHVSFSPDGRWLLVAGGDRATRGEGRVWDVTTGQPVSPVLIHAIEIRHAAFSPDARWVATRSSDGLVHIWEVATGREARPPLPHSMVVRRVQFSPDGGRLLTACRDGAWRVWDLGTKEEVNRSLLPSEAEWRFATFGPRGDRLAAGGGRSGVRIYRVPDVRLLSQLPSTTFAGAAQYSPDARLLAVQLSEGVTLFDADNGDRLLELPGKTTDRSAPCPAFSPDGLRLATAVAPSGVRLWDSQSGRPLTPVLQHPNPITSMAFSPDSKLLVVGCGERGDFSRGHRGLGEARVWETATGRLLKVLPHPAGVSIVRFSPDGRLLLTGCSGGWPRQNAYLWNVGTLERHLAPLSHDDGVSAAAFSPDSSRIATGSASGALYLWSTRTGKPFGRPMKHARGVSRIVFSPDGRLLASASSGSTATLWDGITGEALSPPLPHPNAVMQVEFSPDGNVLSTVSYGYLAQIEPAEVRLYRMDVERRPINELRALAEALAGFRIDEEGTERLLGPEELGARISLQAR